MAPETATADLALSHRAVAIDDALVVADLHLGKGAAAGVELPIGTGAAVLDRLSTLLDRFDPATLVLAGDVLHSFGTIPLAVSAALEDIEARTAAAGVELVVLEGNHDTQLDRLWDGEIHRTHRIDDTVVCHGDVAPTDDAERYIVGHDHPTLEVAGRRRPCYLAGDAVSRDADLVVLPAFNRLLRGVSVTDMTAADFQSPLVTDVASLRPIVWDDDAAETLVFPRLGGLRDRL